MANKRQEHGNHHGGGNNGGNHQDHGQHRGWDSKPGTSHAMTLCDPKKSKKS